MPPPTKRPRREDAQPRTPKKLKLVPPTNRYFGDKIVGSEQLQKKLEGSSEQSFDTAFFKAALDATMKDKTVRTQTSVNRTSETPQCSNKQTTTSDDSAAPNDSPSGRKALGSGFGGPRNLFTTQGPDQRLPGMVGIDDAAITKMIVLQAMSKVKSDFWNQVTNLVNFGQATAGQPLLTTEEVKKMSDEMNA